MGGQNVQKAQLRLPISHRTHFCSAERQRMGREWTGARHSSTPPRWRRLAGHIGVRTASDCQIPWAWLHELRGFRGWKGGGPDSALTLATLAHGAPPPGPTLASAVAAAN